MGILYVWLKKDKNEEKAKKKINLEGNLWVCEIWLWKDIVVVLTLLSLPFNSFTQ